MDLMIHPHLCDDDTSVDIVKFFFSIQSFFITKENTHYAIGTIATSSLCGEN